MGWELYDQLIEGIPGDVRVVDYGMGLNWSWLSADSGCGISYTCRGGKVRGGRRDLRGRRLRDAASLSRSWSFEDATFGVAALNAWYSRTDNLEDLAAHGHALISSDTRKGPVDPFHGLLPELEKWNDSHDEDPKVVVVGHFPHVEDLAQMADLTVLERNCRNDIDVPDTACEYVVPEADFLFLTGVTLINKTAPRLLELGADAYTVMVGPSVIPSRALFDYGADELAGRAVEDAGKAAFACASRESFGSALSSYRLRR